MIKILTISANNDNQPTIAELIGDCFPLARLFAAPDGQQGIELAIAKDPDVILLDILLPGMESFEVCRRLKQIEEVSDIPVVFLTENLNDKPSRIKALEMGAGAFLSSPVDKKELIPLVNAMVKIKTGCKQNTNGSERPTDEILRESEYRFRHVLSSMSDISYSCVTDVNGNSTINWLYGPILKITGYTKEELLEMKCWGKLVVAEDLPVFNDQIVGVLPGSSNICQLRLQRKDGSIVWVQASAEYVKDETNENAATIFGGLVDITRQKMAEEKIKEREEKFASIFEHVQDVYYESLSDGTILEISPSVEILSRGQACRKDLIGRIMTDFYACREERTAVLTALHDQGSVTDYELAIKNLDGSVIPCTISAKLVYDSQGHPTKIIGSLRDITDRKLVEKTMRESELFFRESQKAAFIGSYKFELQNDCWSSSEVLDEIFGIGEDHPRNLRGWLEITHPDDREMMAKYFAEEVMAKRNPFNKEYRIFRKSDGETRWMLGLGKLDFDMDDNIVSMTGTVQDITDRKQAEEERIRVNRIYAVTSQINQMIVRVRELDTILAESCRIAIEYGKFRMAWIGLIDENEQVLKPVACHGFEEGYLSKIERISTAANTNQGPTTMAINAGECYFSNDIATDPEMVARREEALQRGYRSRVALPIFVSGKVLGSFNIYSAEPNFFNKSEIQLLEEVTSDIGYAIEMIENEKKRRQAEEELVIAKEKAEESDRLKSAFLANMSHEIRTPLNSIIGFSELMCNPEFDQSLELEFAQMINASGNNLLSIISDIMDLSKIEAGQVQVNYGKISVNQLLIDIRKEYSFRAGEKGIELRLEPFDPKLNLQIETDEIKIRQILINFIGNAIKFTDRGFIAVGALAVGDTVQFQVKDTGIGIPLQYHHTIFERFRQLESPNTRKYGGNGLGLAISKGLVELLGGTIWMESEPGVGSTFYFTVPK